MAHLIGPPQHFQSFGTQERITCMLSHNKGASDAEQFNIGGKPGITSAFETKWLDALVDEKRRYKITKTCNHIFISIDPSAAKDRNLYVLMSFIFVDGNCVILGAECMNTSHSLTVSQLVVQHVIKCREIRHLNYAKVVIIPECNLPHIAQQLQEDIKNVYRLHNHCFMIEDSGKPGARDLPGNITTHKSKLEMVHLLKSKYLQTNNIFFYEKFINVRYQDLPFDDIRLEIMTQLRGFRQKRWYRVNAEGNSICEIIYTGKPPTGDGDDDFVMAILIAVYCERKFFDDKRYVSEWGV